MLTRPRRELADCGTGLVREHGRPWVYARSCDRLEIDRRRGIASMASRSTARRCERRSSRPKPHSVILAAVSAGPELEREAKHSWQEEKPDEYFFLEMYGSAVVEHLIDA